MIIDEKRTKPSEEKGANHKLLMEDRCRLTIGGVENVESFSDCVVILDTSMGRLAVKGENLHVNKLDVGGGDFSLDGKINSLEYQKKSGKKGGFMENLFK